MEPSVIGSPPDSKDAVGEALKRKREKMAQDRGITNDDEDPSKLRDTGQS